MLSNCNRWIRAINSLSHHLVVFISFLQDDEREIIKIKVNKKLLEMEVNIYKDRFAHKGVC